MEIGQSLECIPSFLLKHVILLKIFRLIWFSFHYPILFLLH